MTRILIVTPVPDQEINNGVSNRTNGLARALESLVDVRVHRAVGGGSLPSRVSVGLRGMPPSAGRYSTALSAVPALVEGWKPDIVHADTLSMVPGLGRLPPAVLRLASLNDSYGLFTRWLVDSAPSKRSKAGSIVRAEVASRSEIRACNLAHLVHVVSAVDAVDLRARGVRAQVDVVPNAVDPGVPPSEPALYPHPVVVFHGALGGEHAATLRALVELVWPEVRSRVPTAELHVIGGGLLDDLERELRSTPGVVCRGFVDDLHVELARAWVGVVPVPKPNGQSTKALDILWAGTSLCADPAVAGGIPELEHGRNSFLAPVGPVMSEGLVRVLSDERLRRRLSTEGRALAQQYTWSAAAAAYLSSVEQARSRMAGGA